ncbi:fumarylacetoacetate hydrolase family protein [Paraburkholderia sp. HP33-1]|uniref:fumarylacetoacetate hydrolase family protein n=1 Tax=Paraburkholderia sp. HP33-1 TaxID=2883243 RepID=UPI001F2E5A44|nr:fumarylacetoacetate hydrolase family protein [Paraburkholderia sp. HP33-1]
MSVNVVHFEQENRARWGVLRGRSIVPLEKTWKSTGDFIRDNSVSSLRVLQGPAIDLDSVHLLSPVTRNQQFLCQGANYRQHMIESGMDPDVKSFNMFFTKASSCIVAADSDVVRPSHVRFLDYEVELGIVLRCDVTAPRKVTTRELHEVIAGIVIVDDISARDVQIPQMQFYKGKSYRTFGPVGPVLCLLEPDDFAKLHDLRLTLKVNGEVRQQDSTANLVYGPAETLTELFGMHDVFAGDLVATGTPAGCALSVPSPLKQRLAALLPEPRKWRLFSEIQQKRKQYLKPGDAIEARIVSGDGTIDLGVQRNRVRAAA